MRAVNDATERRILLLDESLPKVVAGLEQAATVVGSATSGMESISENLSRVATEIGGTSTTLAGMLTDAIGTMDELAGKTADAAQSLAQQQAMTTDLTRETLAAVETLEAVSRALNDGFASLGDEQDAFLANLRQKLSEHSQEMAGWLADYAEQVRKQTVDRMTVWNEQTAKFTNNMVIATQALSDAIDEFDAVKHVPAPREAGKDPVG